MVNYKLKSFSNKVSASLDALDISKDVFIEHVRWYASTCTYHSINRAIAFSMYRIINNHFGYQLHDEIKTAFPNLNDECIVTLMLNVFKDKYGFKPNEVLNDKG